MIKLTFKGETAEEVVKEMRSFLSGLDTVAHISPVAGLTNNANSVEQVKLEAVASTVEDSTPTSPAPVEDAPKKRGRPRKEEVAESQATPPVPTTAPTPPAPPAPVPPAPSAPPAPPVPSVNNGSMTMEGFRLFIKTLTNKKGAGAVVTTIQSLGYDAIADIPAEQWQSVINSLNALPDAAVK